MRPDADSKWTTFPHLRISCAGVREGAHCKTTSSRESELVTYIYKGENVLKLCRSRPRQGDGALDLERYCRT
jgi:hypothetical protein